jgi:hypothetical protein
MRVAINYYPNSNNFGTYNGNDWGFFLIGIRKSEINRFYEFLSFEFMYYKSIKDVASGDKIENVLLFNIDEVQRKKFPFLKSWVNDYLMHVSSITSPGDLYKMLKSLSILFSSNSKDLSSIAQGLFAELSVLQQLILESEMTEKDILTGWQNVSSKGLHDFNFADMDLTIEVKSKLGSPQLINFDSFEQLSKPQNNIYTLSLVKLNATGGVRLKDKINEIRLLVPDDYIPLFNSRLFITSDGLINLIKDFSFSLLEVLYYDMSRFINCQLPDGVSVGKCTLDSNVFTEKQRVDSFKSQFQ